MLIMGLDLGQAQDYTAIVISEATESTVEANRLLHEVRYIERFPLGTPYPDVVNRVITMLETPQLKECVVIIDNTGVGRAVSDLFRKLQAPLVPVTITGGGTASQESGCWRVPKIDLVGAVQVCLQTERLKISRALPEASLLVKEMLDFKMKYTQAANVTFNAREGAHDDLVLACALAVWYGERIGGNAMQFKSSGKRSTSLLLHQYEPRSIREILCGYR